MNAALRVYAGRRARTWLRERGLRPEDVRIVPGAAGGPKGLALNALDRFLFGQWLPGATQTVHLVGASIGAWRLACACLGDAEAQLARLAEDYIGLSYEHRPGQRPAAGTVTRVFRRALERQLGGRAAEVLGHGRLRLHVFATRGRHLLASDGRWRTPAGYLGAFLANAAARRALGLWVERVVFSDPRDTLPISLSDFRTRTASLTERNLVDTILASCSVPLWLDAVRNPPDAPGGTYWDGGITDYHLHLDYATLDPGLVLYPHFVDRIVPGWLDKPWRRRHRATPKLDNVVVLVPDPAWVARLPRGKLPDRGDFKAFGEDHAGRMRAWRRAVAESERLAEDFARLVDGGRPIEALPLA